MGEIIREPKYTQNKTQKEGRGRKDNNRRIGYSTSMGGTKREEKDACA